MSGGHFHLKDFESRTAEKEVTINRLNVLTMRRPEKQGIVRTQELPLSGIRRLRSLGKVEEYSGLGPTTPSV